MKVLVCGSRDFGALARYQRLAKDDPVRIKAEREYKFIMRKLDELAKDWPKREPDKFGNTLPLVTIISGTAPGVDSVALDWAVVNWCHSREFPADWKVYGHTAGIVRNQKMLTEGQPDLVVAFPGGRGTADMKRRARAAGVKVVEIGEE